MSSSTTTAAVPTQTSNGGGGGGGGPTSSPLLFFVALGFGVVFTNLWIIVGVKYCFRYNQRNRAARALNEHGEPIDLDQMPNQRRRRREKKLMTMEEVNERFPLTKYKIWRSAREAEGLPAAGGVVAPVSSADSKDEERAVHTPTTTIAKHSVDSARPQTALSMAQQDHANAVSETSPISEPSSSTEEKMLEKGLPVVERTELAETTPDRNQSISEELDDDEDDPIRTAAPPEMLAAPGDTCAICLDTLDDDDDVRGLTCGHAFHGSCVDPWFTGRRACCPLCKTDYYIPKIRSEAEGATATGRRSRHASMPQQPPIALIGRRGVAFRTHMMLRPHAFLTTTHPDNDTPSRQERRRREQDAPQQDAVEGVQTQTTNRTWRSPLRALHMPSMPRFGRRGQQEEANSSVEPTTASDLEAGVRR